MAVCSSKKVNFSQVANPLPNYELTIPTSLPLYLILAYKLARSLVILVMGKTEVHSLIAEPSLLFFFI